MQPAFEGRIRVSLLEPGGAGAAPPLSLDQRIELALEFRIGGSVFAISRAKWSGGPTARVSRLVPSALGIEL